MCLDKPGQAYPILQMPNFYPTLQAVDKAMVEPVGTGRNGGVIHTKTACIGLTTTLAWDFGRAFSLSSHKQKRQKRAGEMAQQVKVNA